MKRGCLRRGIAIFLLAFAVFDLGIVDVFFPQRCGDDQVSVSGASPIKSTEKIADESVAISDRGSQLGRDSSQSSIDEDCFCCYSHIIPVVYTKVAILNDAPHPYDLTITSLPSSPPRDPFHPPRFS